MNKEKLNSNVEKTLKLWNKEYKRGFFSYIILLMLKDKPMYGFEIYNKFLEITKRNVSFEESAVYHILKKLKEKGFISAYWKKSDKGPDRKYYTVEKSGIQLLTIFTANYILPINKAVDELIEKVFPEPKNDNLRSGDGFLRANDIPKLRIGNLEAKVPIIQGGMGVGISLSGLASAVANAGGIGVIAAAGIGMLEPDYVKNFREANKRALRKEIRRAREMTDGIIGVNIMLALSDFDELVLTAVEEGADLLLLGAGLLLKLPGTLSIDMFREKGTKVVPIVSSARAAKIIFQSWAKKYNHLPDAVVVEGPKAGGHLGFKKEQIDDPRYSLEKILPEVVSIVKSYEEQFAKKIPVIAAGGIFTGADIYKFMQLGAGGVQMATRFVATEECDASIKFKESYLKSKKEDIVIIDSPVGMPGRAIRDAFLDDVSRGIKKPFKCPWKCLKACDFRYAPYCINLALTNAKKGILEDGFVFAGANAYRVNEITTVEKLINVLLTEYIDAASSKKTRI